MALTKEQFATLYNKGLSVDQIAAFDRGETPETIRANSKVEEKPGFFKSLAQDPLKTLIVKPGVRFGQAIGAFGSKLLGVSEDKIQKTIDKPVSVPTGILGDINIEPQKQFGEGGGKQILGDLSKATSYLYTGGAGSTAIQTGLKSQVLSGAFQGAKAGVVGGGTYAFGDAIADAENSPSDVAYKTLFGAALGGATGGIVGAAVPVVVKTGSAVKKYTNINELNQKLTDLNTTTLKPTPSQTTKWTKQGVDPMRTYTEIFATEIPQVDKNNRFVRESVEDFVERIDDVYRPGAEGFNTILRNSPEVNNLSELQKKALSIIDGENLTPVQKQQAKSKVLNEISALKEEARNAGKLLGEDNIPVAYTDNLKDRFWANTKYFGDESTSVTNATNRALGHSFADGIESVITDLNVKQYNKQLQQYIVLKEYLSGLSGKLAGTGGRASRLVSRVVGGIAGSKGGPVGSLLGSITGDKLAQIWMNPASSPERWLILQALKKLPLAKRRVLEQEANEIIQKMFQKRMETLRLPAPTNINILNQGKAIPVLPKGRFESTSGGIVGQP